MLGRKYSFRASLLLLVCTSGNLYFKKSECYFDTDQFQSLTHKWKDIIKHEQTFAHILRGKAKKLANIF